MEDNEDILLTYAIISGDFKSTVQRTSKQSRAKGIHFFSFFRIFFLSFFYYFFATEHRSIN